MFTSGNEYYSKKKFLKEIHLFHPISALQIQISSLKFE